MYEIVVENISVGKPDYGNYPERNHRDFDSVENSRSRNKQQTQTNNRNIINF